MPADTRKLVTLWKASRAGGEEAAIATVVRVAGSSYRKPGARMIMTRNGRRAGTVSGGCLEAEVARKIWWLTEHGPALQDYSTSFDDDSQPSYGLGCDGVVSLLLERVSHAAEVMDAIRRSIEQRTPSAIVTVIGTKDAFVPLGSRLIVAEGEGFAPPDNLPRDLYRRLLPIATRTLQTRQSQSAFVTSSGDVVELLAEYIAPPPALFLFGAGDDAQPVAHLAHSMGWEVTVADGRSHLAAPVRFPSAQRVVVIDLEKPLRDLSIGPADAAVLLTHSFQQDAAILRAILPLQLGYLGVLGPRRRTKHIVQQAAASIGVAPESAMEVVKSPVGLDLGTGSPEVIALSIIAEIQAVLSQRSATPLHFVATSAAGVAHD